MNGSQITVILSPKTLRSIDKVVAKRKQKGEIISRCRFIRELIEKSFRAK